VSFTGGIIAVATPTTTPALTVAGTSGGIPYFSSASTWASSGALTANGVVLGGGAGAAPTVTAADSTTTHALFATAGAPAFRALASSDLPAGTGTVTSVGWTGGIVTVATATTTPAFTIAGTSGGIPYFSSASTWASTPALTQFFAILGGGPGNPPTSSTIKDDGTAVTINQNAVVPFTMVAAGATANTLYCVAGKCGIGTANPVGEFDAITTSTTNSFRGISSHQYSDGANAALVTMLKAQGTVSNPTAVVSGDFLGSIAFFGHDGTLFISRAAIQAVVNGAVNTGNMPTDMIFVTGSAIPFERARIDNNGCFDIGLTGCAYSLDVSRGVGLTGTARFFDQTATTGSTLVTITPGASQTAASLTLANGGSETIAGTLGVTGLLTLTNSSFSFNGKTCTIVATVVTCV
jgi:hypothetical protein